ncbi:hypothetical protein DITRI_Ditri08aG0010900 [Diplodiscus trichospermus]
MVLFPSFFLEGLARTVTKKGRNNSEMDLGREAAETMAKDAKKNELMLRSSGSVKSNKSNNFASFCSKRGQKGINQDCAIVWEEFGCQEDMIFCGIFDGHGPWGHIVAKRVKESVPPSLLCNWQKALALTSLGQELNTELNIRIHQFDIWKQSYLKTYADIDLELKLHPGIDSFRSGTTALTIIKQGEHLVIANVGDSRAVMATTSDDGNLKPLQLTVDFKPNIPEEAERIRQSKGQVFCLRDEPGVHRVWMPNGDTPGLALSRALEAVEIVSCTEDREKSAKRLVQCAIRAWKYKKRGIAMDDISAICLFFHPMLSQEVVNLFKASTKAGMQIKLG